MHEFAANFDSQIDEFISLAEKVQNETVCKSRLTFGITATQPCEINRLADLLPAGSTVPSTTAYRMEMPGKIGMRIPAQINYAAQGYHLKEVGMKFNGSMKVAEKILSLNYFWNEIRAKGGAYGASFSLGTTGDVYTYTYRDPSPATSIAANSGAADYLVDFCERNEALERYIISTVSEDEPLRSPASSGNIADLCWIAGDTKEDAIAMRNEMLNTTRDNLLALVEALKEFAANGTVCVVGHQDAIDACGDMTPMEI